MTFRQTFLQIRPMSQRQSILKRTSEVGQVPRSHGCSVNPLCENSPNEVTLVCGGWIGLNELDGLDGWTHTHVPTRGTRSSEENGGANTILFFFSLVSGEAERQNDMRKQ